jgi:hypothetical protein
VTLPVCARPPSAWSFKTGLGGLKPRRLRLHLRNRSRLRSLTPKVTVGWDETDPIVIEVDALRFNVSAEFKNESWHLVVRES